MWYYVVSKHLKNMYRRSYMKSTQKFKNAGFIVLSFAIVSIILAFTVFSEKDWYGKNDLILFSWVLVCFLLFYRYHYSLLGLVLKLLK